MIKANIDRKERLQIALNANPFVDLSQNRIINECYRLELLGYNYKDIKIILNAALKTAGVKYKATKYSVECFISVAEMMYGIEEGN